VAANIAFTRRPATLLVPEPVPGVGVLFVHRHRLDPSQCIYIGAGPQDAALARRLVFQFVETGP
jgi:hypothetical protein